MIIYVDVLLIVNFIVDFFLIKLTSIISSTSVSNKKCIIAAAISSLFSLYIFLPELILIFSVLLKTVPTILISIICIGYKNVKILLRWCFTQFTVSFIYAGVMMALSVYLGKNNLSVYNGVVYFNISPLFVILLSGIIYIIFLILSKITQKTSVTAKRINISLFIFDRCINTVAMSDTGHTLKDIFGNDTLIIIDKNLGNKLFDTDNTLVMLSLMPPITDALKSKYRLVTVSTVTGNRLLPTVKLDKMIINLNNDIKEVKNVSAVITDSIFDDDYSCILPQKIEGDIL